MPGLIAFAGQIWMVVEPVDMCRRIDGLSMLVQQVLERSPCAGSAFVFCNRTGNRLKVLLWDGSGVWLCQRACIRESSFGRKLEDRCFELTQSQWEWLTAGVDWRRLSALPPAHLRV